MSVVFTFSGKMGDAILQWPVAFHWAKETGKKFEVWMDEVTCKPLVPLFEAQPCVEKVKLVGGVENYACGGQPFHMNLPTSAFSGNTIYHLGFRCLPSRQISLEAREMSKVPLTISTDEFADTPCFDVGPVEKVNRLVLHGKGVFEHSKETPTFWKFIAGIKGELETMFEEIVFVGSDDDREVGSTTYPEWKTFDDGGDFLKFAQFVAASRAMIGVGSAPITMAGALKIPGIRVHDKIGDDAPRMIWDNLGGNQLNRTEVELRKEWPVFRDKWLSPVAAQ